MESKIRNFPDQKKRGVAKRVHLYQTSIERMYTLPTLIQHSTGSSSHSDQTRKRNKRHPNWEEEVKLSLFVDNMIVYIENLIDSTKNYST